MLVLCIYIKSCKILYFGTVWLLDISFLDI
jgi:hypothetical protein